ncbi:phosphohydrolase [Sinorhizobium meliloti]|uniref:phosphohydrolase n=1 Tax=Rhizobium meliloti TaxID=382 RepID=UPI001F1D6C2E|nr:phosphohydrolase [Sinorhizobium meliloti]
MSEALKLWFFRDLSDEQRLKLFALFGLPVDEIGKVHGRQAIAVRHIARKLVELVRDETAPPPPENHVIGLESRKGDWMQTVTGRQFWPIDPRPEDVHIEDIAHALSMMCRFGGHCDRFYSVAEHSVLVSENVPPQDALWALLHDASEAYIADIVRPAKRFINGYKDIEGRIMAAVCGAFDLPYIEPRSVKRADNAILADEAAKIMGTKPKDWILPEPPLGVRIIGLSPADAKAAFLTRYRALTTATTEGSAE